MKGAANTVATYGSAILDHATPIFGGLAETFISLGAIGFGASGDFAGGVLCLTGVGCLVGVPAIAASTTLIVGGAYGTADGIDRFSDGLGQALREASEADSAPGGGGAEAGALGDRREEYVADLIGGKVARVQTGKTLRLSCPTLDPAELT